MGSAKKDYAAYGCSNYAVNAETYDFINLQKTQHGKSCKLNVYLILCSVCAVQLLKVYRSFHFVFQHVCWKEIYPNVLLDSKLVFFIIHIGITYLLEGMFNKTKLIPWHVYPSLCTVYDLNIKNYFFCSFIYKSTDMLFDS